MSSWRRNPFFWALVGLSLITLGFAVWQWDEGRRLVAAQSRPAAQSKPAPDFRLPATDGSTVSLRDLRGQVVLMNFWATWCPPCQAEMPDLNALARDHGAKHNFVVVGVNVEEERGTVEAFVRQYHIAFPVLLDASGDVTAHDYNIRTLPMSLIVDRQGNIRDTWTGQLTQAAMLARLERVW